MRIAVAGGTGVVGSYVVLAARATGHEVVVLTRSNGVDLLSDQGVSAAVRGVEVIIDTTNAPTASRDGATEFFVDVTRRLQRIGEAEGVARLVTLSIVGIDRASAYGYYAAKLRQEEAALAGPLPSTILRATQFHEFAAQLLGQRRIGPIAPVPVIRSQPIAARTVGEALVEMAVDATRSGLVELAGPLAEDVVSMARLIARHRDHRIRVLPIRLPGRAGRAFRSGALLPSAGTRLAGPTFREWLLTGDSSAPEF